MKKQTKSVKKTPPAKKTPAKASKAAAAVTPPSADPKPESAEVPKSSTPIVFEEKTPDKSLQDVAGAGNSPPLSNAGAESVKQEPADAVNVAEARMGVDAMKEEKVEIEEVPAVKEKTDDEVKEKAYVTEDTNAGGEIEHVPFVEEVVPEGNETVEGDTEAEGGADAEGQDVTEEHMEEELTHDGQEEAAGEEEGAGVEVEEQIEISDMIKQRKIKKEREIFIGGLDRDATEEDVKTVFEKLGEVVEVRVHKDFATNKNKGFAFVMFASKELADKALADMKNPVIRGKRCGIAASEDNDTLFLGNICNTWTKEAIKRKLKDYGIEGLGNITLVEDTQKEGLSRGFAFLEFSCHGDAMLAYKRLQKPDVIFGHPERTAKVAFAEPLREPDAEVMAQVKSVFVDGMPPYWDEDRVKEHFKGYGEIERVVLARNMSTAKRKDFGFVNFATHEAALTCIGSVNNTELGDGKSKVKVRARLANPLPKTQAVKGGMRGGFRIGHASAGAFSRFGRGFGRGRFSHNRGGFPAGRGFFPRGRGRGPFSSSSHDFPQPPFRGRRPFVGRGGRRGAFALGYEGPLDDFAPYSSRGGAFNGGRGRTFQARRPSFPSDADFGGTFDGRQFGEDLYYYGDVGRGVKRPFSMMEDDYGYLESARRLYPRREFAESSSGRYRDMNLGTGGPYHADGSYSEYYDSNLGARGYSSYYGSDQSGGGQYY